MVWGFEPLVLAEGKWVATTFHHQTKPPIRGKRVYVCFYFSWWIFLWTYRPSDAAGSGLDVPVDTALYRALVFVRGKDKGTGAKAFCSSGVSGHMTGVFTLGSKKYWARSDDY